MYVQTATLESARKALESKQGRMPSRPGRSEPSSYSRATMKLSGSDSAAEDTSSQDTTRSSLDSALGRWANAGGIGSSRDAEEEGRNEPSWTTGMWQER